MRLLLCIIFAGAALHVANGQTAPKPSALPKVTLTYLKNGPFDEQCAALNKPAKQEDMDELSARVEELQQACDQELALYLQIVLNETARPFPRHDVDVTLTACDFPSMSSPLIVYCKSFLSSASKPHPVAVFPIVVFHELMHIFLRSAKKDSELKKKYQSESPLTLGQMHVMALEKFVLTKLGRNDVLQWLDTRYRVRFSPEHRRAWEIVNDVEGYEVFIKEMKAN